MKWLIIAGTVGGPVILYMFGRFYEPIRYVYLLLALFSAWIFGSIAANSVYQIIHDNTVFMTNIHAIFLNPYFLLSGAYLGNFFIYRILTLFD